MGYRVNGDFQEHPPEHGVLYSMDNPCYEGGHEYSEFVCSCGRDYCYNCSGFQNVDAGGDVLCCPDCGNNNY